MCVCVIVQKLYDKFGLTGDKLAGRVKEILGMHSTQAQQMGLPVTFGALRTHFDVPSNTPISHARL